MNTNVVWLGVNLKNPIIVAPLTLVSHKRIEEHARHYEKIAKTGVGAIIVESCIPIEYGDASISFTQNDLLPIESGLGKNQFMSFTILGPSYPNVCSIKYAMVLIKEICSRITDTPIIGSIVVNFGEENDVINAAKNMVKLGIKGLELNCSCPNILTMQNGKKSNNIVYRQSPSLNIVKSIKEHTGLGISLKLAPGYMLSSLDNNIFKYIDGITCSNAYVGLMPPSIDPPFGSQFGRCHDWAYSGIYGPFERLLTYASLAKIKKDPCCQNINLSVVGGIVEEKHIVESLLLGADTIQISSAVFWKGFRFVKRAVSFLEQFMRKNYFNSISDFKGKSLNYILSSVADIKNYSHEYEVKPENHLSEMTVTDKCTGCHNCLDMCCLALHEDRNGKIVVNKDLCSGCGWCQVICPVGAFIRYNKE